MRITTRLNVAVFPAVIGLALVVALAYWGERDRQAPPVVLAVAIAAAAASGALAWWSTRSVARGVAALSEGLRTIGVHPGVSSAGGALDELATIRLAVTRLAADANAEREAGAARVAAAESGLREYEELLDGLVRQVGERLREGQLSLHVLLESRFGPLSENQEELIRDARDATDATDAELRRLARLVRLGWATGPEDREPVTMRELLAAPIAMAEPVAAERVVTLQVDVPEDLPRVLVPVTLVREALAATLGEVVRGVDVGGTLRVSARRDIGGADAVTIQLEPGTSLAGSRCAEGLIARRILRTRGRALREDPGMIRVTLPAEG